MAYYTLSEWKCEGSEGDIGHPNTRADIITTEDGLVLMQQYRKPLRQCEHGYTVGLLILTGGV